MSNPTNPNHDNSLQMTPALQKLLATGKQRHPQHDFTPLLELVTSHSPDGYEAFFNQVAELVSWQLQDDKCDNAYLMKIMHELFRFRDAFREMRGGEEVSYLINGSKKGQNYTSSFFSSSIC